MAQGLVAVRRQKGFSYVIVMFLVAILSVAAVRALENTLTLERRDKEREALWRGKAYRDAIRLYYESSPGTGKSYPQELKDLLYDQRLVRPTRPLRRLYTDPLSGGEWGVIRNDDGRIIGVHPNSNAVPLKQEGFPDELGGFTAAKRYTDWKFVYQPR
jgi:type II secretory pathway pseudopilin PulG